MLDRLLNYPMAQGGYDVLLHMQLYPALLCEYALGITAVDAGHWQLLHSVLNRPQMRREKGTPSALDGLRLNRVLVQDVLKTALEAATGQKYLRPGSEHLYAILREPLRAFFPDDAAYEAAFDRFEYLLSLMQAAKNTRAFDRGRWSYKLDRPGSDDPLYSPASFVIQQLEALGSDWPPLQNKLFDGGVERVRELAALLAKATENDRW